MTAEDYRIWTVVIRGFAPISLVVRGNPTLYHEGGESVHHLVLAEKEIPRFREGVTQSGNKIEIRLMSGQTEEQATERTRLNTLAQEPRAWPTVKCPGCPWFDPLQESSPCGAESWPPETIDEFRRSSPLAEEALRECEKGTQALGNGNPGQR